LNFLDKLRKQPEYIRKFMLWSIVIILGLILTAIWINGSYKKIQKLKSENIIQELNLPKIEMPAINE